MRRGPLGALAVSLLLAIVSAALPARSQEGGGNSGISIAPVRVEFFAEDPGPQTVTVFVTGAVAGTVELEMFDLVPAAREGTQRVDYGSTSASLSGALSFDPPSFRYVPDGTEQQFTTTLSIDPAAADDVRYGELVATVVPSGAAGEGESQAIAGVAIKIVTAQAAEGIPPADIRVSLDRLTVRPRSLGWTIIDKLLPDIPGVIGHGPAIMEAEGRNVGDYFLDEVTVFEVRRVSPLTLLPFIEEGEPRPILKVSMRPRYVLPGQTFIDSTTTLIPLDGGAEVDALPLVGFVKITARATGSLGGVDAEGEAISKTVLVAPWSEGLVALMIWILFRGRRQRDHAVRTPRRRIMGIGEARRGRRLTDRFLRRQSGDPDQPTLF